MKKFKIIFLVFIGIALCSFVIIKAVEFTNSKYIVSVEAIGATQDKVKPLNSLTFYGNTNHIAAKEDENIEFCFYTENDIIVSHESKYYFTMTGNHHFKAYFKDPNKHYVVFIDANDKLLSFQVVNSAEDAVLPEKPNSRNGYTFSRWNKDHTNVTEDLVIKAIYAKKSSPLTVYLEINDEKSVFEWFKGDVFTVEASHQDGKNYFSHWEVNGQKRSISTHLDLTITEDTTIKAIYSYAPHLDEVILYFNENVIKSDSRITFSGAVEYSKNHAVVDYGVLTLPTQEGVTFDINHPEIKKLQALKTNEIGEFAISIDSPEHDIMARAYVVVRVVVNNLNEYRTYYSNIIQIKK